MNNATTATTPVSVSPTTSDLEPIKSRPKELQLTMRNDFSDPKTKTCTKDRAVEPCSLTYVVFSFNITGPASFPTQDRKNNLEGQELESASEHSADKASSQLDQKKRNICKISIKNECQECQSNKKVYDFLCTANSNNLVTFLGKYPEEMPTTSYLTFEDIRSISVDDYAKIIQNVSQVKYLFDQLITIWDLLNTNHIDYDAFQSSQLMLCSSTNTIKITELEGARLMLESAKDWNDEKKAQNGYKILVCGFRSFIDSTQIDSALFSKNLTIKDWKDYENKQATHPLKKEWLFDANTRILIVRSFVLTNSQNLSDTEKHLSFKKTMDTENFEMMMEAKAKVNTA